MITRFAIFAATAAALTLPAAASAAPASDTSSTSLSNSSGIVILPSQKLKGQDPVDLSWVDLNVRSQVAWTGDLLTHVGWNTDNVRQGAELTVSRMALQPTGNLKVTWMIDGRIVPFGGLGGTAVNKITATDVSCLPQLMGGGYACTASSNKVTVVRTDGAVNSPYVKIWFATRFTITGEGAIVTRNLTLTGAPTQAAFNLPVDLTPKLDKVEIPCGTVGLPVYYKLSPYHYTPTVAVKQQTMYEVGTLDPVIGMTELPALYTGPWDKPVYSNAAFDLTGTGRTINLGNLKAGSGC